MNSNEKHTISDVAQMLGVSRATVSRALNGTPGVGPELRKKIIDFANEIGYKPNTLARSLSKGRVDIIGLIFGDVRNPFYAELTFHVQKALESRGYTVMIFNSEYDIAKEIQFLEVSKELCLAGLILFTAQTNMIEAQFEKLNIPIVFVNRTLQLQNYDSVLMDNFKAGYIAAMHLIELGHKRIGFINGQAKSSASVERFEGFKQALKNYYLPLDSEDVLSGNLKMEIGYELAKQFFQKKSRPSALVIGNDMMALGFMDWCKENQICIPEELSLVSFDNIIFSGMHGIELTTISQQIGEMGEKAAELMIRRIDNPEADYERIILEPALIVRNTTKKFE